MTTGKDVARQMTGGAGVPAHRRELFVGTSRTGGVQVVEVNVGAERLVLTVHEARDLATGIISILAAMAS